MEPRLSCTYNETFISKLQNFQTARSTKELWKSRQYDEIDGMVFVSSAEKVASQKQAANTRSYSPFMSDEDDLEPEEFEERTGDVTNETTYNEMIETALRALGGKGTAVEITAFLGQHYKNLLGTKTKTWKNSVMGCLSANRRNLFAKEPIKHNAKRYVWKLNTKPNQISPATTPVDEQPSSKRRKLLQLADISEYLRERSTQQPSHTPRATKSESNKRRRYDSEDEEEVSFEDDEEDDYEDAYATQTRSSGRTRVTILPARGRASLRDIDESHTQSTTNAKVNGFTCSFTVFGTCDCDSAGDQVLVLLIIFLFVEMGSR